MSSKVHSVSQYRLGWKYWPTVYWYEFWRGVEGAALKWWETHIKPEE